ncbi:PHD finger-containing protein 6-like isoform X2 [Tasmannia lanceolata]|uniref:PHD finger-containing protein 6-like isoform X2 n=1 Tax=Tasmannia lanceolata TaxID=3420 RepID=UPI004062FDED
MRKMRKKSETHLDKVCEICGHTGYSELLTTCSQCHKASEHIYCMRNHNSKIPEIWFCEACQSRGKAIPPGSTVHNCHPMGTVSSFSGKGDQKNNFRSVVTSRKSYCKKQTKVKYIPAEEAVCLASGTTSESSPKNSRPVIGVQPNTRLLLSFVRTSKQVDDMIPPSNVQCKPSTSGNLPSTMPDEDTKKPVCQLLKASLVPRESLPREGGAVVQLGNSDIQESALPLMPPKFSEDKLPNHPASDALWRGSFEFHGDFYDGIQAHPPSRVSHKAYDISKQMPEKLQFKLQPRRDIWPQIFSKYSPASDDIALYFFPSEYDSSKRKYCCLLELMEMQDAALQCCLGGVELLIFTSKQLPVDSQKLNTKMYLWGVFRRVNNAKLVYDAHGVISHPNPGYDMGNLQKNYHVSLKNGTPSPLRIKSEDYSNEVSMQIDLIGGIDVGRTDEVVPRPIAWSNGIGSNACKSPSTLNERTVPVALMPVKDEYISALDAVGLDKNTDFRVPNKLLIDRSVKVKSEGDSLQSFGYTDPASDHTIAEVPPGFSKPATSKASCDRAVRNFDEKDFYLPTQRL